jgi:hypothetical protein
LRRKIPLSFSGPKNKQTKKSSTVLLGLFFDPEDGSDMFFRNIGSLETTALQHGRRTPH